MRLHVVAFIKVAKARIEFFHEFGYKGRDELKGVGVEPVIRNFSNSQLDHSSIVSLQCFLIKLVLGDLLLVDDLVGPVLTEHFVNGFNCV